MTTLTDRYVAATIAAVPEDQRSEVEADVRAAIADTLEARLAAGEFAADPATAEATVLNDMGDPERLAASYADRRLVLIGPELFLQWRRLTVLLLWIVLPLMAVLIPFGMWMGDEDPGAIVGTTIGGTLTVGVHLVFWVTLVFAVLERAGVGSHDVGEPWTVDHLKEIPEARVTWAETVLALVALIAVSLVIVWQQVLPWIVVDGERLPVLDPGLWTWMLPTLLAVMAIEAVAVIVRHVRGRWTMADWGLTVVLDAVVVALLAVPVATSGLLDRDSFERLGWPDAATTVTLEQAEWAVLAVVTVVCIADAWGSWARARRSREG